jgi:hypothetical protein
MKIRRGFKLAGHLFDFHVQKLPPLYTIGITNETEDCYFIPFLDLDNIYREVALKYIHLAQREFDLSPFILLSSSGEQTDDVGRTFGNYIAIGFDKLKYHDFVDLLRMLPVDELSIKMPRYYKYKSWVLRMSEKFDSAGNMIVDRPKYVMTIMPENRNYLEKHKHSESHFYFLQKLFKFRRFKLNLDGYSELTLIRYNTRGKHKFKPKSQVKYIQSLKELK